MACFIIDFFICQLWSLKDNKQLYGHAKNLAKQALFPGRKVKWLVVFFLPRSVCQTERHQILPLSLLEHGTSRDRQTPLKFNIEVTTITLVCKLNQVIFESKPKFLCKWVYMDTFIYIKNKNIYIGLSSSKCSSSKWNLEVSVFV